MSSIENLSHCLARDGFIHIPRALSPSEVAAYRDRISRAYAEVDAREKPMRRLLLPHEVLADRGLWEPSLVQPVVRALQEALGAPYVMLPDIQVQRNLFGHWHTDSDTEYGERYLLESDYRFVKCGLYLQDNTPEHGGGIQIIARGHTFPVATNSASINYFVRSKRNKIFGRFRKTVLPIKAGDFVAFDARLPHSATHPTHSRYHHYAGPLGTSIVDRVPQQAKYVLYWDATSTERYARLHSDNRRARAEVEEIRNQDLTEIYLTDWLRMSFPESAPDFHRAATQAGVSVFNLPKADADAFESLYRQLAVNVAERTLPKH